MADIDVTPTDAEWRATIEAELAQLKGADSRTDALMKVAILDPVPGPYMRQLLAEEAERRHKREEDVKAGAEQLALELRVRAPEIKKHERKLAEVDSRIAEARGVCEKADGKLAELEGERAGVMREAPVFAPPSTSRPLRIGEDPSDRRRWRLGGGR